MSANIKAVWMAGVFFVAACGAAGRASAAPVEAASSASTASLAVPVVQRLEDFHLLSVSLTDGGSATLRGPDHRVVSLKVGSTLVSAKARLVEVQSDRLRFDAIDDKGKPQTAWMIRSQTPGQLPEVKRTARK